MENNGFEKMMPHNDEHFQENNESHLEGEINQELEKFQANTMALHDEIEAAALSGEKEELLSTYVSDTYKKRWDMVKAIGLGLPSAFIGYMETEILPQLNWKLPDDKNIGEVLTITAVGGLAVTAFFISEYFKYKKRTDRFDELATVKE